LNPNSLPVLLWPLPWGVCSSSSSCISDCTSDWFSSPCDEYCSS
jgi:hypothetical protein